MEHGGVLPTLHIVAVKALAFVVIRRFIAGVAVQAIGITEVVEIGIGPVRQGVASGAVAGVMSTRSLVAGGAILVQGVLVVGFSPVAHVMAIGAAARIMAFWLGVAVGAARAAGVDELVGRPVARAVAIAAARAVVVCRFGVAAGAIVIANVAEADPAPGFGGMARGALPRRQVGIMIVGCFIQVAAQAVFKRGVVVNGVLPIFGVEMAAGAGAGVVELGRLVGVARLAFVDILMPVFDGLPIGGGGMA